MSKAAITEQYLEDIADAIRSKTGLSTETYLPSEMAPAIMTISGGGGITPTGTISISENGIYNVTTYASAEVDVPTGSTINNQDKTVNPSTSQQSITYDSGYTGLGTVTVTAMPVLTLPTITSSSATSGYTSKATINRSTSDQYINIPTGYNSAGAYYKINAIADGSVGTPYATKSAVSNYSTTITPYITYNAGYITSGNKSGTAVTVSASELVSGTKSISANGTNIDVTNYAKVDVAVPSEGSPTIDSLSITPTESEQTFNSSSVDGYKPVVVEAISSTYVGSGIDRRSGSDITTSIYNNQYFDINYAKGYYDNNGSKSLSLLSLPNPSISIDSNGLITSSLTITSEKVGPYKAQTVTATEQLTLRDSTDLTTSGATVSVPAGYYAEAASKSVTSGSAAGPSSLSGSSASITTGTNTITLTKTGITTTPTVSAGYISSATASSATVALTASATVNPTLTVSGATVTAPAGYYSDAASASVSSMTLPTSATSSAISGYTSKATIGRSTAAQYINIPPGYNNSGAYYVISATPNGSVTAPSSISGTTATISTGNGTLTLTKTVSVTPNVTTAGYISSGTAGNSSVSLTANATINPTPTASGATVTIPAGYYTQQTTKSVSSGSATAPSTISGTAASVSTGTNTLTFTKTVSVTPTVSAGYVSAGTAGNSSVSLTASVTTKAAATITPTTTDQTIASGTYLTGAQTIAGDADLVGPNIVAGAQIFGVNGQATFQNYYTGSSAPSSSLGSNGDIYLQE